MRILLRHAAGRTPMRVLVALMLAAAMLTSACREDRRREVGQQSRSHPIATVNNERIALADFQSAYQTAMTNWERFVFNDPGKRATLGDVVLQQLIEEKILDQEVRRRGIELDEAKFRKYLRSLTASGADSAQVETSSRRVINEWNSDMRRRALRENLVRQQVQGKIRISRRTLREYYQSHGNEFMREEQVRVRHIAVGNRDVYNRVRRLLRRGVKFVKLVKEFSITPDRDDGGDLGYVTRGVLPPEFDKAIFPLTNIGSLNPLNKPVRTQIGYHIFRLEGRRSAGRVSFQRALPSIRKRLLEERQAEAYVTWLRELRRRATIKIDRKLLKLETG